MGGAGLAHAGGIGDFATNAAAGMAFGAVAPRIPSVLALGTRAGSAMAGKLSAPLAKGASVAAPEQVDAALSKFLQEN